MKYCSYCKKVVNTTPHYHYHKTETVVEYSCEQCGRTITVDHIPSKRKIEVDGLIERIREPYSTCDCEINLKLK